MSNCKITYFEVILKLDDDVITQILGNFELTFISRNAPFMNYFEAVFYPHLVYYVFLLGPFGMILCEQ